MTRASALKLVNLEAGMPTVPQALTRLAAELKLARSQGTVAIKFVHGYGSTGSGGALRMAIQAELAQMAARREIRAFIAGDDWRISNESTWAMIQKDKRLREDSDLGRANRGISVVWL